MRWEDFRRSDNIEDRRDDGQYGGGGGGFGLPVGGGGLGIGTILVLGLIGWALGIDPRLLIGGAEIINHNRPYEQPYSMPRQSPAKTGTPGDQTGQFVAAVLGDTEDQWNEIFTKAGKRYRPPRLVLYAGRTVSGCGAADARMGPFYCPNDQKVYLDTTFFRDIERRFHGCDVGSKACRFSEAYVIAHEVGHHVQNLLGILPRAEQIQRSESKVEANRVQVRIELQADCFAGVWANHSEQRWKFLEPGDVEAALQTASAIGDDRLQRQTQGTVVPDAFTHGTSEQRVRWFTTGLKNGTVDSCNTFAAAQL